MNEKVRKFASVLLILLVAVLVQVEFGCDLGYGCDFVLAALIGAAFFLDFLELVILILLSIWLLNFEPAVSVEMAGLAILPSLAFWGKRLLPGKSWFINMGFLFFGILIFYAASNFGLFLGNLGAVFGGAVGGALFGVLVFRGWEYFYGKGGL